MRIQFWSAIVLVGALSACAGAPKTAEEKKSLSASVATSIELVKKTDPTIEKFFKDNYAYAVLPSVGKGGFLIGGAGGDGEVYKGGKLVGYCSMGQGTIGATIGGQSFDEFIFFKDETNYNIDELTMEGVLQLRNTESSWIVSWPMSKTKLQKYFFWKVKEDQENLSYHRLFWQKHG